MAIYLEPLFYCDDNSPVHCQRDRVETIELLFEGWRQ
jgi:hypothetical protein